MLEAIREDPTMGEDIMGCADYLRVELHLAARTEMITKLEDFMRRRSKIELVVSDADIRNSPGLREVAEILFGDEPTAARRVLRTATRAQVALRRRAPADLPLGNPVDRARMPGTDARMTTQATVGGGAWCSRSASVGIRIRHAMKSSSTPVAMSRSRFVVQPQFPGWSGATAATERIGLLRDDDREPRRPGATLRARRHSAQPPTASIRLRAGQR